MRAIIDREGEACTNAIIFCNRKTDVDIVAKSLKKHGLNAAPIHGDLDQSQRTKTLESFRDGELRFLVASDVAARGLDIPSVRHVFNYDVPSHSEDYVHRIGRTGRAGRDGKAVMISAPIDDKNLAGIEKLIGKDIPRAENPIKSAAAAEETEDKPKRSRKPKAESSDRKPAEAKDQKDAPKRGRRSNEREKVVGMGDHMPSFIAKSFAERKAS